MMWKRSLREILVPTCLMALILTPPSESLQIGGHKGKNLGDLVTASIIGLAIGGVRDRLKKQQEQKPLNSQLPKASANIQNARFMPIRMQGMNSMGMGMNSMGMGMNPMGMGMNPMGMLPLQGQIPLMQASHMLPSLRPQMFQPNVPLANDMSPFLMWGGEEAFAPMASQLMQSVLAQQPMLGMQGGGGFPNTLDGFGDMSAIQQQWQALESQAMRTILSYGAR